MNNASNQPETGQKTTAIIVPMTIKVAKMKAAITLFRFSNTEGFTFAISHRSAIQNPKKTRNGITQFNVEVAIKNITPTPDDQIRKVSIFSKDSRFILYLILPFLYY